MGSSAGPETSALPTVLVPFLAPSMPVDEVLRCGVPAAIEGSECKVQGVW
jgi:hypothetical protein